MIVDETNHAHGRRSPDRRLSASAPRSRAKTMLRFVVLAACAVGLVAAGAYWHEAIARALGNGNMASAGPTATQASSAASQLWTCGMHPQVIQDHPGNCPICHMHLTPLKQDDDAGGGAGGGERKIAYYWDPMIGPASISEKPGKSAMNMELVPVYQDAVSAGTGVRIDPVVVQNMGVRVAAVTRGPLTQQIRAVGYLREAEPLVRDVNLRVSGWIEKLYADTEGQHVEQGAPLFDLYSPEVQVAVQELIAARKAGALKVSGDDLANQTSQTLLQSGRGKLEQWGLDAAQIEQLANADTAPRTVTFKSPVSGHLTMKNVVEGASIKAGDRVLQIVDHGTLWLDMQVYEQDLPYIRLDQFVSASVQSLPGRPIEGTIIFVSPHVDPTTRTAAVRVALANPEMKLRPGMYATAEIASQLKDAAILVPREAVIDTGTRVMTFVSAGNGRFEPRELKLGASGDGGVEVLAGVAPGASVVTSGQFLLDAESRMKEAIQRHLDDQLLSKQGGNAAAMPAADPTPGEKSMLGNTADLPANMKGMSSMDNMNGMSMPPTKDAPNGDDMRGMPMPASKPESSMPSAGLPLSPDVDNVYHAYLVLTAQFAADDRTEPAEVRPLIDAAARLEDVTTGAGASLSKAVRDAAAAMAGQSLKEQRKLFRVVGAATVALARTSPPSQAVGADKFVVIHCPMLNADWLQTNETILNPYMPTMRTCGEVTGTIPATSGARR